MSDIDAARTHARKAITNLLNGNPPNGITPDMCGPWRDTVIELNAAHTDGGTPDVIDLWNTLSRADRKLAALVAGTPATALPNPAIMAALPSDIVIDADAATECAPWLDDYITYASQKSPMTPRIFHESAGLWLTSVAVARRLKVGMSFGDIYPNLFCIWIAPTTLWNKTTALSIARDLADRAFPWLIAPQDVTPESLMSDMAGGEPSNKEKMDERELELWKMERNFAAQRGWVVDEMSGLVASSGKEYNAGLLETFMRFFDCENRYVRSTRSQGRLIIRNAYLTMLGASTPSMMAQFLAADRLWGNGWWPRFALLTPEEERPAWNPGTDDVYEPPSLVKHLSHLYTELPAPIYPDPAEARSVMLGRKVMQHWQRYNKALRYDLLTQDLDTRLYGLYGRLPTYAIKLATLLAAMDWERGTAPIIEYPHLMRAFQICESWRASAHRSLVHSASSETDRIRTRLLRQIAIAEPTGISERDLGRRMKDVDPNVLEQALQELSSFGEIEEIMPNEGKRGRPSVHYRVARQ